MHNPDNPSMERIPSISEYAGAASMEIMSCLRTVVPILPRGTKERGTTKGRSSDASASSHVPALKKKGPCAWLIPWQLSIIIIGHC
ncbi:hypothetical protein BRADI_4g32085v3 [Brachypodium distachyon]|uniref:Uncharacterized protein n=1 Tax=Brachypodium distachyon TaxID=15368 RepID=A0A2K2CRQ8_BRADI|nr:hypothetical protein BRADI_4g32085v3 [Brachypodium distachyon]